MSDIFNHAKKVRESEPDEAARYARAAMVLAAQEEFWLRGSSVDLIVTNYFYGSLAHLPEETVVRLRSAVWEHRHVTERAAQLRRDVLVKLGGADQPLTEQSDPRPEFNQLVLLASPPVETFNGGSYCSIKDGCSDATEVYELWRSRLRDRGACP